MHGGVFGGVYEQLCTRVYALSGCTRGVRLFPGCTGVFAGVLGNVTVVPIILNL